MPQLRGPGGLGVGDTTDRSTTQKVPLGFVAYDNLGNSWRYIKAGATIALNDYLRFQGSALGWDDVRPTSAAAQPVVGLNPSAAEGGAAFATGEYGFALVDGVGSGKTAGAVAANVQLVSSATAGQLAAYANTDITAPVVTVLVNSASPQVTRVKGL